MIINYNNCRALGVILGKSDQSENNKLEVA